jgi:hypothetical protein
MKASLHVLIGRHGEDERLWDCSRLEIDPLSNTLRLYHQDEDGAEYVIHEQPFGGFRGIGPRKLTVTPDW